MYYIYNHINTLFIILFLIIISFSSNICIQGKNFSKNIASNDIEPIRNPNFCLEIKKSTSECKLCIPGYNLTPKGQCSFTKNCLTADPNTGLCLQCEKNNYFDLDNYECKSYLENDNFNFCIKVLENTCIECISSYFLSLDNKCVTTKNCKTSLNNVCIECTPGSYLSLIDKKCSETENCLKVNSNWECDECNEGFYYNKLEHKCLRKNDKNSNLINCKSVLTKNDCDECEKDFYLNLTDLSCYKNSEKNNFYKCAKSDNISLNCEKCISEYYLASKNKKCSNIYGCNFYENDKCFSCEKNFCHDLKNDLCFPMNIENDNYIYDNKEYNKFCINCYLTNIEGTGCIKCKEGYFVGENGVCITTLNCDEAYNGICSKCKDNYCLNESKICQLTEINNCLKCENDNQYNIKCTECNPGYGLNENNICYKCETGCKICTNENNCSECFEGYYLEQKEEKGEFTCKKCNESCKKCLNEDECQICADDYYEEKDENDEIKCIKCPEGCDDCSNKLNCVKCKSDYKLVNIKGESFCIRTKKTKE